MTQDEYLFQVLDSEEFDGDGPHFAFFKRDVTKGDIPLFIKNPPRGLLWSTDPEMSEPKLEEHYEIKSPSDEFDRYVSLLMEDPSWRATVSTKNGSDDLSPQPQIDEDLVKKYPLHEHFMLKLVEGMVIDGYEFPPELAEYLLDR